jgi:hypothetical protein
MKFVKHGVIVSLVFAFSSTSPALAAKFTASSATLKAVFAAAGAGDTIALTGSFGKLGLSNRSFAKPLIIDARKATFTGTLDVDTVDGLMFVGGRFGTATSDWQNGGTIRVQDSGNITFKSLTMIGDGLGKARGITFHDSKNISLLNSSFTGFRGAGGVNNVTNGLFSGNRITKSTSDGFNFVDSHFITATGNICSGGIPSAGAHPDCIQLWSLVDRPVQSDIRIIKNKVYGYTQGFTSFDPERGGGLRIEISDNYINTSQPNGIACYACVDSIFTGNVLITAPGANYLTRINIIGGSNNVIANNSIGPGPGKKLAAGFASDALAASVPEPMVWAQMLLGFGLVGATLRRQVFGASR